MMAAGGLSACATHNLPDAGAVQVTHFSSQQAGASASVSQAALPEQWWQVLGDPTLSALLSEAANGNLDIQLAAARVEESRAQAGLADAALSPQLGAGAGYTRSAISQQSPLHRIGASTKAFDTWQAGFQASWEIDLWGALRGRRDAAVNAYIASRYGHDAVRIAMLSEVARQYLLLRGVQARLQHLQANIGLSGKLVALVQSQERNGVVSHIDVARSQAGLSLLMAQQQSLQHQQDSLMNALALLLGKPPAQLNNQLGKAAAIPALPLNVAVGLPSELAHRRPDILQAEAQLQAAVAGVGAAKADFYPRFSLTGNWGVAAFHGGDLSMRSSQQYSFGPTLYLPIFDGGRLKSTLALSEAKQVEAGLAYRKTLLNAWHEVDDALNAYQAEATRHQQLQAALKDNQLAWQLAERNFTEGTVDRSVVLHAQQAVLASQTELDDSAVQSVLSVVALYKALGGGWSTADNQKVPS